MARAGAGRASPGARSSTRITKHQNGQVFAPTPATKTRAALECDGTVPTRRSVSFELPHAGACLRLHPDDACSGGTACRADRRNVSARHKGTATAGAYRRAARAVGHFASRGQMTGGSSFALMGPYGENVGEVEDGMNTQTSRPTPHRCAWAPRVAAGARGARFREWTYRTGRGTGGVARDRSAFAPGRKTRRGGAFGGGRANARWQPQRLLRLYRRRGGHSIENPRARHPAGHAERMRGASQNRMVTGREPPFQVRYSGAGEHLLTACAGAGRRGGDVARRALRAARSARFCIHEA